MKTRYLFLLCFFLALPGVILFTYKVVALGFPISPDTMTEVWNIEARITFDANEGPAPSEVNKIPVKVTLHLPRDPFRFKIMDEHFIAHKYGLTVIEKEGNREAVWAIRKASGMQNIYYKAVVRNATAGDVKTDEVEPKVGAPNFDGAYLTAAREILAEAREKSADVNTLVSEIVKLLNGATHNHNVQLLLGRKNSLVHRLDMAARILALEGIPAQVVHGIRLGDMEKDAKIKHWLEVYHAGRWYPHDPVIGGPGVPERYLAWWKGSEELVHIEGGGKPDITLSVSLNQERAIENALARGSISKPRLMKYSLFSLPVETQVVYRTLLMIPVGAFIIVILRNVVGLQTIGTFMPVLIALSFRETRLIGGIVLFSLMVGLGLSVRLLLERLQLLHVPRVATVLMVVVMFMLFVSILSYHLGIQLGLSVALFPMIILTMTIEKICIVWEEMGALEASTQAFGSLLAASLSFMVMSIRYVQHIMFVFPEVLLIILAVTILLGRYSGYRLFELYRFRYLAE
ncbi:MAG TPA: hypothetical protein ENI77_04490 [Nitrospirae bacterium]|nr:hypothetical protein [Nitrospirota bacterium]